MPGNKLKRHTRRKTLRRNPAMTMKCDKCQRSYNSWLTWLQYWKLVGPKWMKRKLCRGCYRKILQQRNIEVPKNFVQEQGFKSHLRMMIARYLQGLPEAKLSRFHQKIPKKTLNKMTLAELMNIAGKLKLDQIIKRMGTTRKK